jgi:hypothetical protein
MDVALILQDGNGQSQDEMAAMVFKVCKSALSLLEAVCRSKASQARGLCSM